MEPLHYRERRGPLTPPGQIECHVRDMTATVSADVLLTILQDRLLEHGQWLPIDGDVAQSVGTLVSADSTGPLRLGYGAWRDLLLGMQFINGNGELVTAGGRVVKNVAGYDLTKFMVGQRGIFGSPVTITTRTYRQPAGAIWVRHAPDAQILSRLIPTSLRPQWAVLTSDALLCGYLGDEPTLAFYRSAVARSEPVAMDERSLEEDIAHRAGLWTIDGPMAFRASVPPARLGDVASRLGSARWAADAAFGIVVGSFDADSGMDLIRQVVAGVGGSVRFFRGSFGSPIDLSTTPGERRIIERLKAAFDPDHKLNPLPWSAL